MNTDKQTQTIIEKIKSKHGQFASIRGIRQCKVKKGGPVIFKEIKASGLRLGLQYKNRADVDYKGKGMPGFEYTGSPHILRAIRTQKDYLCCHPTKNSHVEERFLNESGQEIPFEEIEVFLLASEKSRGERKFFLYGLENIQEVK